MAPKTRLMVCTVVVVLTGGTALPVAASSWTRGYVVGTYQYAFRYGGRPDFTRGAEIEPGVDCPHGSTTNFANPDQTRIALARQKWRSKQEIDWIVAPPGLDQVRDPGFTRLLIWDRAISYRGYKPGIETYVNPWAADDPGQPEVTSRIAEGFNLDGKINPTDFVSPDGEKGIDNALYRAGGCYASWRARDLTNAFSAALHQRYLEGGLYTMVIRISGNQDPMNDSDATMEIGYSPDKIVKDARGGIAVDYSYRILKSAQYTKLKAKIKNGVVETEQVEHLHTPRIARYYHQTGDTNLTKGKIRLNIVPNGLSGTGLIGGYRNWRDLYVENSFPSPRGAGFADIQLHEDHIALYYALRRKADGMLNPKTGQYDGISTAYRITLSSAYVVDADKSVKIPLQSDFYPPELWRRKAFESLKANIIKGIEARIPQAVPPGILEAGYPQLEQKFPVGLPGKDFFLKTLDRPHYPDGVGRDDDGNPIDDQGERIDSRGDKLDEEGDPLKPPQARQQVSNGAPATATMAQEQ
ncbi:hypothetical protein FBZ93_12240 [Bradyrhizobium macuxiense]|uniref:Tle cognate immunity protein 4 C-terminal domain-containing protein n=1 Tax=Bradyrhizobium macuxiense TaxID=1755647 RepID=A0A560KVY1_9BRAD|nr:hypothetical protein [Bradyrhizobium macuxiense]TWB87259.1 hypothetical protein FBZ93_12240 [Bradyrhizobium macuxiense]